MPLSRKKSRPRIWRPGSSVIIFFATKGVGYNPFSRQAAQKSAAEPPSALFELGQAGAHRAAGRCDPVLLSDCARSIVPSSRRRRAPANKIPHRQAGFFPATMMGGVGAAGSTNIRRILSYQRRRCPCEFAWLLRDVHIVGDLLVGVPRSVRVNRRIKSPGPERLRWFTPQK